MEIEAKVQALAQHGQGILRRPSIHNPDKARNLS